MTIATSNYLFTRIRQKFSHLNETKFRHNYFLDTLNLVCHCGSIPETTNQFLLRCQNHEISSSKLLKNLYNLDQSLRNYDDGPLIQTFV